MNIDKKNILIDRYLKGELDQVERLHFEDLLNQDPQLREDLRLQQISLRVGDRLSQKELSNKFKIWDSEISAQATRKSPWIIRYKIPLLLIVTTIVALGYVIYNWPFGGRHTETEIKSREIDVAPTAPKVPIATNSAPMAATTPKPTKSIPNDSTAYRLKQRRLLASNYMDTKLSALNERDIKRSTLNYRDSNQDDTTYSVEKKIISLLINHEYNAALLLANRCSDPNNKILFKGMAMFYLRRYSEATTLFYQWKAASNEPQMADQYILISCICARKNPDPGCVNLLKEIVNDSTRNIPWNAFIPYL